MPGNNLLIEAYDEITNLVHTNLAIVGITLIKKHDDKNTLLFIIYLLWTATVFYLEIRWLMDDEVKKKLTDVTFNAMAEIYAILVAMKTICIFLNQNTTRHLITKLKTISPDISNNQNHKEYMIYQKSSNQMKIVAKILFLSNFFAITGFMMLPCVMMIYKYTHTGEIIATYMVPVNLPTGQNDNLKIWGFYTVIIDVAAFYVICSHFGVDCLFYNSCSQIHMHFQLLKHKFSELINSDTDDFLGELKLLIDKQNFLYGLCDLLQKIFFFVHLYTCALCCLVIVACFFNISSNSEIVYKVTFSALLISTIVQIFVICFYGNLVIISSMDVANGIFNSAWYRLPANERKYLRFVLMRTQKPFIVRAGGYFPISISTFSKIMKLSWSYFTLLRSVNTD